MEEQEKEEITKFQCMYCEKIYNLFQDEVECGAVHEMNEDKYWQEYRDRESKVRLLEAGNAKGQTKLVK